MIKQKLFKLWIEYFRSLPLRRFQRLIPLFLVVCMATPSVAAVIDVRTYGAIPNDSIDDSLAIQKAIDAAPDHSTIYFPQGTYLLAGVQINNRIGLTLSGDGSTLTILKRHGNYPNILSSTGSTDMLVTQLGFDANGIDAFGGFIFYDAKRVTITKNRFFDSNKQPLPGHGDRYAWVFGRGGTPSEDLLINDNLIEDLQLEVDFGLRVRIEGNTVIRPVAAAGIGVFTIGDYTTAEDYVIEGNTVIDAVVGAGAITFILDPPSNNNSTFRKFRVLNNRIVYTTSLAGNPNEAILFGTGNSNQPTTGNLFDDIIIQNNTIEKADSPFQFMGPVIFGNSYYISNFKFDNTQVINNRLFCNTGCDEKFIDIREQGANYVESGNVMGPLIVTAFPNPPKGGKKSESSGKSNKPSK